MKHSKTLFDERRNTMSYTLKQAAEAAGKSKPTILRAIQTGKISALKHDITGGWMIEPAELHRLFPLAQDDIIQPNMERYSEALNETLVLRRELELKDEKIKELQAERERESANVADLRRRLDIEAEDRRRLTNQITALLTDQSKEKEQPPKKKIFSWFRKT